MFVNHAPISFKESTKKGETKDRSTFQL
jgi:hypothetical protein